MKKLLIILFLTPCFLQAQNTATRLYALETKVTKLIADTVAKTKRIIALEKLTKTHTTQLATLTTKNTSQDVQIVSSTNKDIQQDSRLTALETLTKAHTTQLATLTTKNTSQDLLITAAMNKNIAQDVFITASTNKNTVQDSRLLILEKSDTITATGLLKFKQIRTNYFEFSISPVSSAKISQRVAQRHYYFNWERRWLLRQN